MTDERWQGVKALFQAAVERPIEERDAFLAAATGDDAALRREVESFEVGAYPVHAPLPMPLSRLSPD